MTKILSFSNDGHNWVPLSATSDIKTAMSFKYQRVDEEISFKEHTKEQIKELLRKRDPIIEYSTDGGYSWQPLRKKFPDEDIARIIGMLTNNYGVRFVTIEEKVDTQKVTQQTGSFFSKARQAQTNSLPKEKFKEVIVFQSQLGYDWSEHGEAAIKALYPNAVLKSRVTHKIVYDMKVPNSNEVAVLVGDGNLTEAALGFVFKIYNAESDATVATWAKHLNKSLDQYVSVHSARVVDNAMRKYFDNCDFPIAVLGDKYLVNVPEKLGSVFLLPKNQVGTFVINVNNHKGAVEYQPDTQVKAQPKPDPFEKKQAVGYSYDVTPEYIMGVREQLEKLIASGDKEKLADALLMAVAFRNKCIDEIKLLNNTIEQGKQASNGHTPGNH